MKIQQGDQYAIPIDIKIGNTRITPENCTDVRVKVGKYMVSYDGGHGDLFYNETDQKWCFPLTEEMSFNSSYSIGVQIGVCFNNGDYIYSDVQQIDVGSSMIKEYWGEQDAQT